MREMMVDAVSESIENDSRTVLLLADIGVWAFREVQRKYPQRVRNIGIFEQGMVSLSAGLSLANMVPVVYGISPFIVQRALEQLKIDFVYQKCGGNFITTGASYDFSTLGYTHYCAEDVATLSTLPGMEIITPGTPSQFKSLYTALYNDGKPTYFRMTDHCNQTDVKVEFGRAAVMKTGEVATVIAAAEMLEKTMRACDGFDVNILYYTTMSPFDETTLQSLCGNGKILIVSPFYCGTLVERVTRALRGRAVTVRDVGVPDEILRCYGIKDEIDQFCGLTVENIRSQLTELVNG